MRIVQRKPYPGEFKKWLAALGALLLISAGLLALHAGGIRFCRFSRVTGWPCAACGSARAMTLLAGGSLVAALRQQPLFVSVVIVVAVAVVWHTVNLARERVWLARLSPRERRLAWMAAALLIVLNWAYLVVIGAGS